MTNLLLNATCSVYCILGLSLLDWCVHIKAWNHGGHLYILPSLTSLTKCWCIISVWLWDDILLGVELRCCILLNLIRNPHLMPCNMYDINCLSGCTDSSRAHFSDLRGSVLMCSKQKLVLLWVDILQTPKDVIGTCRTH